jgi:hypothetical protein
MNTASKQEPKDLVDNRRWMAYAAASAAGALVCQGAEADIIHVTVGQVLNAPGGATQSVTAAFMVGQNSSASIYFRHEGNSSSGAAYFGASVAGTGFAGFAGFSNNGFPYALNLVAGQNVSTAGGFLPNSGTMAFYSSSSGSQSQFLNPDIGFLGFQFNGGNGVQYGWARVDMSGAPVNSFEIIDYAYGDVGQVIKAGQTPEPGSLGLLAAGAAGLAITRRRRRKKSDS